MTNLQLHISHNRTLNFENIPSKIFSDKNFNKPLGNLFWTSSYREKEKSSAWLELCRDSDMLYRKGWEVYGYVFEVINKPKILEISNQEDVKKLLSNKKYIDSTYKYPNSLIYENIFKDYDILWIRLRKYGEDSQLGRMHNYKENPFINFMCESMVVKNPYLHLKFNRQIKIVV